LYDQVGKNAKNLYPGFGDPILNLECTQNGIKLAIIFVGMWLLATCKSYLLLLPTVNNSIDGF
jgi:hypothetical protein